MFSRVVALSFLICFIKICVGKFVVPPARFEAIAPYGFRVSIPDVEGITLFGFHGNSLPLREPQVGEWARDVNKPINGRWTYTNRDADLSRGEKVYFWTYVLYDGVGYREQDGEWTFTGVNMSEALVQKDDDDIVEKLNASMTQALESSTSSTTAKVETETTFSSRNVECQKSPSEVQSAGRVCSGDLLFESNFKTLMTLDEIWTPEVVFPEAPDYPFVVYMNDDHISLNNGHLAIKPVFLEEKFGEGFIRETLVLKGCTGDLGTGQCKRESLGHQILPPIISGKLTTKNSFNFKYGRVEVRAKFPKGSWILPGILLEPRDKKYGSLNYASGVMKIASIKCNEEFARRLVGGAIMNDKLPFRDFALRTHNGEDVWNNDFHNYTLVWMPDRISLYVDGENYGNIDESESFSEIGRRSNIEAANEWASGNKIAPFDQMFYISLGVQAGGVKVFSDETSKPWKNKSKKALTDFWNSKSIWGPTWSSAELQVESVRVYAL